MRGKRAVLLGLGISNRAAVDFLLEVGMSIEARDAKHPEKSVLDEMNEKNIDVILGDGWLGGIKADIILRSPSVRPDLPELARTGAYVTSEIELFAALCPCPIYAITGSDGKTTTTTIVSELLKTELEGTSRKVWLGGNIGTPLLPFLCSVKENDVAVLELSSFQLMTMKFSPEVAIVTNVTPNHLNWHLSMDEYIRSKRKIFENQRAAQRLVLNAENEITSSFSESAPSKILKFSSKKPADAYIENGALCVGKTEIVSLSDILIPGKHNAENFMAAFLATLGTVSVSTMKKVAENFGGVKHRLQLIHLGDSATDVGDIKFYNSSIDTSPTRTIAALSVFNKKVILIIGGYDKNLPIEPMKEVLINKTKRIVCTGQTGRAVYDMMKGEGYAEVDYIENFDDAVVFAANHAQSGDSVLLSPAAASFDSFKNFEERGERFEEIIKKIK